MESIAYIKFLAALVFVLGLILALTIVLRKYGPGARFLVNTPKGRTRRMRIVEVLPLDPRRRLVIVQRDSKEYVLLLSPNEGRLIDRIETVDIQEGGSSRFARTVKAVEETEDGNSDQDGIK